MNNKKNILITGASSGLGYGMALEFAQMGYNLALCARRIENLEILKNVIHEKYPEVTVHVQCLDVDDHPEVFRVFRWVKSEFGHLDRVIVNAGIGYAKPIGVGGFSINARTANTNFVSALAQCEAAVEIFREQNAGHLVTICSFSALRGMPKTLTTYAATKAGLANLTEGIRSELFSTPIEVTAVFPGYIRSEINEKVKNTPFMMEADQGCRLLAQAIEKAPSKVYVPTWPWAFLAPIVKILPVALLRRIT